MYDVIIIGAGVCGAAVAMNLSRYNVKCCVLEKENDVAVGTSKANSGIVHAGYDPSPETLMAELNVRGAQLTEEICRVMNVPYRKIGSLVIAFNEEDEKHLEKLYNRGLQNGVEGMEILEKDADKLHAVVDYLLEHETMSGEQFAACMEGREIGEGTDTAMFDGFEE